MLKERADFSAVMATLGEAGRYQVPGEERVLVLYPQVGTPVLIDVPADGVGRCYPVDRVGQGGKVLAGLVAAYVRHAHEVGACPMSAPALRVAVGLEEECVVVARAARRGG